MKSQEPTIAADGRITCPSCGAEWYDCTHLKLTAAPVPASEDPITVLDEYLGRVLDDSGAARIYAVVSRLRSQVERMKADQMELIGKVIEQFRPNHPKRCTCGECQWWVVRASNTRKAALRRLSSDNSEATK